MAQILDQYGQPIARDALAEPQTSRIAQLQNAYLTASLDGLTPARLVAALRAADMGDLTAQHRIFADMEERDGHLLCEINKRKLAVMDLDWDIVPPPNATAAEKALAEWVKAILTDAVDPIEDLILALMDGPGHGFAPVELEWRQAGRERLPAFHPRPQEWFRLDINRRELRLQDSSAEGAALWQFGWIMHTHGKPKTGYIGRMGLHRVLVWPFLYKAYAIGDFAEFLETYGLPIIVGKYFSGATADEKASLMRAVTSLGHDARAIMPKDMELEIQKITGGGDSTPHLAMSAWADGAQSKAILGQTLSAEAKPTGLGSGLSDLHNEVRHDIRNADARQIAGTLTRDLIYPLIAINRGGIDGLSRCPRFVFDTGEAEDFKAFADSLPKLAAAGMKIDIEWAHEKLRIPVAKDGATLLTGPKPDPVTPPADPSPQGKAPVLAANSAVLGGDPEPIDPVAGEADRLASAADPEWVAMVDQIQSLVDTAPDLASLQRQLTDAYGGLPTDRLVKLMAAAFALAELKGMADVQEESIPSPRLRGEG